LRSRTVELSWFAFAIANAVAMFRWGRWETIPFHFIWVSLTLVYGFRVWRPSATGTVLGTVAIGTALLLVWDVHVGSQEWAETTEVPLMSAMFLAMVWHARRRQQALGIAEQLADQRASLLQRQQRFLHDASHELRTPVTIARGHLEVLERHSGQSAEVAVALDELNRMERIVERLLRLARSDQPDFVVPEPIDIESFLEDVFLRWAEVAPRRWRLGPVVQGVLHADPEALREALDALLENAVKYSAPHSEIELGSRAQNGTLVIDVRDRGRGIPADAVARIFERFARADAARSRADGGVGLGLAIVDAIVKAHDGRVSVRTSPEGSTFSLVLPGFTELSPDAGHRAPVDSEAVLRAGPVLRPVEAPTVVAAKARVR
jgi:signal transduction histidine kinase